MFDIDSMVDINSYIKKAKAMLIFCYSTEHLLPKDKVRFYYALKGRDGKSGIVKAFRIIHLGRTVLMVPAKYKNDMLQFFQLWNLPFTMRKAIVDEEVSRGGQL